MRKPRVLFSLFCFFCIVSKPAHANEALIESLQGEVRKLNETVESLHEIVRSQSRLIQEQGVKISALERGIVSQAIPQAEPERAPKMTGLSQGINPDIGVVGTIQAKSTQDTADGEGNDAIALKELELNISQYVDPYSRLDTVVSFNDALEAQNIEIEEGYYTHWGLPFGFQGQIGKFRSKVGKQNLLHLDQLETADYPMVVRNFFGEEGLASSGARLQNWIPNPWDIPIEVTGEILRGNNGTSFSGISRRPIFNTHLKSFFPLTDDANLELGGTVMFGDENPPTFSLDASGALTANTPRAKGQSRYGVQIYGTDATLIWNLPQSRKLKFQNEFYVQDRTKLVHANSNPWGFYSLVDFRFHPRWSTGFRFDYVQPLDLSAGQRRSTGISPCLTFWQSEFADFQLQYSYLESEAGKTDNQILLKADVVIGSHKHPVQ